RQAGTPRPRDLQRRTGSGGEPVRRRRDRGQRARGAPARRRRARRRSRLRERPARRPRPRRVPMIKYIGSKRRLVPVLARICEATGARTALDLFTGTTRVAQAFKQLGTHVTAVDTARYSEVLARCYVETDATAVDKDDLRDAFAHLASVPGEPGYFTETFCVRSRFFQPFNGARVDAIRAALDRDYAATPLYPLLLTSLIEAADRVDSTTGVQMAYVKEWAPRSYRPLELRAPDLLVGRGCARRGDAV